MIDGMGTARRAIPVSALIPHTALPCGRRCRLPFGSRLNEGVADGDAEDEACAVADGGV